jgi:hypothetical protein
MIELVNCTCDDPWVTMNILLKDSNHTVSRLFFFTSTGQSVGESLGGFDSPVRPFVQPQMADPRETGTGKETQLAATGLAVGEICKHQIRVNTVQPFLLR